MACHFTLQTEFTESMVHTPEDLLKGILGMVGRTVFPPDVLYKILAPTKGSKKQILAYNLCDGATPQAEISKKAKLDTGNLSRSIARWLKAGIAIRVGTDKLPLHIYPLTDTDLKTINKRD